MAPRTNSLINTKKFPVLREFGWRVAMLRGVAAREEPILLLREIPLHFRCICSGAKIAAQPPVIMRPARPRCAVTRSKD
jgi:hypothetical protein